MISGVATAFAMVSGEAPGREADTLMVGKLRARQGRDRQEQVGEKACHDKGRRHQRGGDRDGGYRIRDVHRCAPPSGALFVSLCLAAAALSGAAS